MKELLPCPFCGETPDVNNKWTFAMPETYKYGCVVCCCFGPDVRTCYRDAEYWRDDAIEAWNTRVAPPDKK